MKKLTSDDWDDVLKSQPSRYFVHNVEDGKLRVTFVSDIFETEVGQEDILGNVWSGGSKSKEPWNKVEAQVLIHGEPKLYSMGAKHWSFIRQFVKTCRANDINANKLPGSIFDIERLAEPNDEGNIYTIEYIGRDDSTETQNAEIPKPKEVDLKDNKLRDAKDALDKIKDKSPELMKDGQKKSDFLKMMLIKAKIKPNEMEALIPQLIEDEIITELEGKFYLL